MKKDDKVLLSDGWYVIIVTKIRKREAIAGLSRSIQTKSQRRKPFAKFIFCKVLKL